MSDSSTVQTDRHYPWTPRTHSPGTLSYTQMPACDLIESGFAFRKTNNDTKKYKEKAKGGSFQPTLRTWSEVEGAEDELQTKSSAYPLPNNKRSRCPSKGSIKKFIDQQNASFKEIDEYELDVEEVE
ncbi:hypothetical protein L1987_35312 [Smallanthus sonchifolius]|uniref:Uncharacterized protein n=1 Tax=Smallanthus sonchifolius TaxID=185202 RepID=A0ACB9HXQ9_9ASTR|nr:hypothetical protein L1987_35312 [Smallanthus sonchifolius]